jgi:PAS domain S-box-containing protein
MKNQDVLPVPAADHPHIRQLFDDYLRMYATRDDRLTALFSEDFSGFTGGGGFLVKDRAAWVAVTRQDFAQIKDPIRIELKDLSVQSLADTVAVATGFFTIHLPIKDHILSRETARLVLVFRREAADWKISHSSISIPYHLVKQGEVYPLQELTERNQAMEALVAERTAQLSEANDKLRRSNAELGREVVERKQAEEALQQSEGRYRSILTASPDDITITDMQGRVLMFSPAALPMFGYGPTDMGQGRPLTDFIVPEDRPRAGAHIAEKLRGVITGPNEYRGLRKDGSTFDIETNSEVIRDAAGAPTGMVFIVRDITARKRAVAEHEELELLNQQLQKSESLGRMAGAIAHHFNNQLHAVMMSLEQAMGALPRTGGAAESLAVAMQAARKASEVSSLMLTYLGQTAADREPLDLSAICARSLSLLQAVMPTGIDLQSDLPSPGPTVRVNRNQLQQILTNLVTNAREATGAQGGVIRVTVRVVAAAEVSVRHRFPLDAHPRETAHACLEVRDEGCGILAQDFEKLFDPFSPANFPGAAWVCRWCWASPAPIRASSRSRVNRGEAAASGFFCPCWRPPPRGRWQINPFRPGGRNGSGECFNLSGGNWEAGLLAPRVTDGEAHASRG